VTVVRRDFTTAVGTRGEGDDRPTRLLRVVVRRVGRSVDSLTPDMASQRTGGGFKALHQSGQRLHLLPDWFSVPATDYLELSDSLAANGQRNRGLPDPFLFSELLGRDPSGAVALVNSRRVDIKSHAAQVHGRRAGRDAQPEIAPIDSPLQSHFAFANLLLR